MRNQGVAVSLWEVFTLFEHLNLTYAKMYYQPQRYHHVSFGHFYRFMTSTEYEAKVNEDKAKRKKAMEDLVKASTESVFALAADLNREKKNEGLFSSKSELEEDEEVVIRKSKGGKKQHKKKEGKKRGKKGED